MAQLKVIEAHEELSVSSHSCYDHDQDAARRMVVDEERPCSLGVGGHQWSKLNQSRQ